MSDVTEQSEDHPSRQPSGPAKHWPGCPAEVGAAPLTMVVPTVVVTAQILATADFFTPIGEVVYSPTRLAPLPAPAVSPPLFISHCTLQI